MAGRLTNVGYITLVDAASLVYEMTGVRRCSKSVYNWVKNGCHDQHGNIVKLRAVKRIRTLYTRREWLNEFFEKVG